MDITIDDLNKRSCETLHNDLKKPENQRNHRESSLTASDRIEPNARMSIAGISGVLNDLMPYRAPALLGALSICIPSPVATLPDRAAFRLAVQFISMIIRRH